MGRPRKSEARDVRTLLLEEAVRVVSDAGEQALRTKAIASAVGVTEPALFHYFGSREGLVEEVQAHRFEQTQVDLFTAFRDAVMKCKTRQEFANAVSRGIKATFAGSRDANRAARINIAGSAVSRPDLRRRLGEAQVASFDPAIDALEFAKARGWTRPDLNTEAFLFWVVAQTSGRYFAEISTNNRVLKELNNTMLRAVLAELGLEKVDSRQSTKSARQEKR